MRERVQAGRYIMTVHGHEEMEADRLNVFDIEHCVLTGAIVDRQKDRRTNEWKYAVEGEALSRSPAMVVAKVGPTGKLVIITVYLIRK